MRRGIVSLMILLTVRVATASEHPGNVYVAGDDVRITLPAAWGSWTAIDVDGKEVGRGAGSDSTANLGKLPVGYFEVHQDNGSGTITTAVVAPNNPIENTPIAIDAAMSWFYPKAEQVHDACTLCKLAGVKWVRDRASWPELEPQRGQWAGETRYERTMQIEHEEGLKILQVNHASPPWASKDGSHFPDDLRDVYAFYRDLAKRWKGLADAIEPWNEPDIIPFGGHTGCEIASFQKAAYLGFKAGNPDFLVNEAVFAIDRAQTLDEFGANEVYPYFDRYDLHHYIKLPEYPRAYARHRAVSGGRPMWVTEFNLTIWWAGPKTHEPSHDDLRVQGYRVGKVFAEALNEGPQKLFYFMFGNYVERQLQYGIVHDDFTPRPAYVAFAAVGRFLDGATPIGRVDFGDDKLKGYLFNTIVDGAEHETLVTWSETKPTSVKIPGAQQIYDYLGRERPLQTNIELSRDTVYVILPPGGSKQFKIIPPPPPAPRLQGKACPVVLQLLGQTDFKQSAFVTGSSKDLRLVAYNFSGTPAHGNLTSQGATGVPNEIEIPPGGREERTIQSDGSPQLSVQLDLGDMGKAIVAARTVATATTQPAK